MQDADPRCRLASEQAGRLASWQADKAKTISPPFKGGD
jgi:hypothetical protein